MLADSNSWRREADIQRGIPWPSTTLRPSNESRIETYFMRAGDASHPKSQKTTRWKTCYFSCLSEKFGIRFEFDSLSTVSCFTCPGPLSAISTLIASNTHRKVHTLDELDTVSRIWASSWTPGPYFSENLLIENTLLVIRCWERFVFSVCLRFSYDFRQPIS